VDPPFSRISWLSSVVSQDSPRVPECSPPQCADPHRQQQHRRHTQTVRLSALAFMGAYAGKKTPFRSPLPMVPHPNHQSSPTKSAGPGCAAHARTPLQLVQCVARFRCRGQIQERHSPYCAALSVLRTCGASRGCMRLWLLVARAHSTLARLPCALIAARRISTPAPSRTPCSWRHNRHSTPSTSACCPPHPSRGQPSSPPRRQASCSGSQTSLYQTQRT